MGEIFRGHIVVTGDPIAREVLRELQKRLDGPESPIIRIISPISPLTERQTRYRVSVEGQQEMIDSYKEALRESGYLITGPFQNQF